MPFDRLTGFTSPRKQDGTYTRAPHNQSMTVLLAPSHMNVPSPPTEDTWNCVTWNHGQKNEHNPNSRRS